MVEIRPRSSTPLGLEQGVRAGDLAAELGEELVADRGVPLGLLGVVADDEPVGRHPVFHSRLDLLDPQVASYCGVAAGPG
jgi:hypothetical protein